MNNMTVLKRKLWWDSLIITISLLLSQMPVPAHLIVRLYSKRRSYLGLTKQFSWLNPGIALFQVKNLYIFHSVFYCTELFIIVMNVKHANICKALLQTPVYFSEVASLSLSLPLLHQPFQFWCSVFCP